MTMAHGLEARVPFLDYTVVEFAASLPSEYKLRGSTGKYLLRKLMANRLPETTLKRRKEGFNIPVSRWLRGELRATLNEWDERLARTSDGCRAGLLETLAAGVWRTMVAARPDAVLIAHGGSNRMLPVWHWLPPV